MMRGQAAIQVPDGARPILTLEGVGVQIYTCQMKPGEVWLWVFQAPEAKLADEHGNLMGSHGAGPTWRLKDGSSAVGEVLAKAAGESADDVPALLLKVKSHAGQGLLTKAEYIRRSDTRGGAAPSVGCDASHPGSVARVPYRARYTFYTAP